MQPLFKQLFVRLFHAPALCAGVLLFFAAAVEAHRVLSVHSALSRPVSQDFADNFDTVAVLNTLEPFSRTLQGCHGTSKVCSRA